MNDENGKLGGLCGAAEGFGGLLDVLFELAHGVIESGAGVVNLVDNEHVLADQVGHFQRRQVEPLCAGDLGAGSFFRGVGAEGLVERETDGLDGDVGVAGFLEEGAQNACRHVATAANGDHEVRGEVIENAVG